MSKRPFYNPEDSPHTRFHIPGKTARTVKVIPGTSGAIQKLYVELIFWDIKLIIINQPLGYANGWYFFTLFQIER